MPRVSVVIAVLDAGSSLVDCVASFGPADPETEVILVDNGSKDGAIEAVVACHPGVRVIRNERNLGFARASNQGLQAASGRYVLFLNSDAFLEHAHLCELMRVADTDPSGAIWQPVVVAPDGAVENAGEWFTLTGFCIRATEPRSAAPYAVFAGTAACMLARRDVVRDLGGFNEAFFAYIEDVDLCWRARLAGYEVRIVPRVVVEHAKSATTRRIFAPHEIRYLTFRNRFRTILANASLRLLLVTVPLYVLVCVAVTLALVTSGRPRSALGVLRALGWPVRHRREVREDRRRSRSQRRVADRSVIRRDLRTSFVSRSAWEMFLAHQDRWDHSTS